MHFKKHVSFGGKSKKCATYVLLVAIGAIIALVFNGILLSSQYVVQNGVITSKTEATLNIHQDYIKNWMLSPNSILNRELVFPNITEAFSLTSPVLLWDLYLPNIACPDMERVGSVGDGGKFVCGLSWMKQQTQREDSVFENADARLSNRNIDSSVNRVHKKCVIYSYGISVDTTFENEIFQKTKCAIHAFDPTIGSLPEHLRKDVFTGRSANNIDITFHKHALTTRSGTTSQFSYAETIFDTMHRLGHDFIDILKIDVEGSEWNVFDDLIKTLDQYNADLQLKVNTKKSGSRKLKGSVTIVDKEGEGGQNDLNYLNNGHSRVMLTLNSEFNGSMKTLPFGQLLIELHYQSLDSMDRFFKKLHQYGFLIFSREINLLPTLTGKVPFAAEYSFINPETFFHDPVPLKPVPDKKQSIDGSTTSKQEIQQIDLQLSSKSMLPYIHSAQASRSWFKPINAVIYFLTRKSRVDSMKVALRYLYTNFYEQFPHYPVLLFHDDLTLEDERMLKNTVPHMKLYFEKIVLSIPKVFKNSNIQIPERTKCSSQSSTIGYRHMCLFHATLIHDYILQRNGYHLKSKVMEFDTRDVEYIMRLDDDGFLTDPIGYDLFKYMEVNEKKYGYVSTIADHKECVRGLWSYAKSFYNNYTSNHGLVENKYASDSNILKLKNKSRLLTDRNKKQPDLKPHNRTFLNEWQEGEVFYNNFEISHVSIWTDKMWLDFIRSERTLRGIYEVRWGDAPLHTIGVSMIVPISHIHAFIDIGYKHGVFLFQKPSGLPPPNVDPFKVRLYNCEYYTDWVCHAWNGHQGLHNSSNITNSTWNPILMRPLETPEWATPDSSSSLVTDELEESSLAELVTLSSSVSAMQTHENMVQFQQKINSTDVEEVTDVQKAVMYSFGHKDREDYIIETLISMYEGYAKAMHCDVVVFYYGMDVHKVKSKLSEEILKITKFVYANIYMNAQTLDTTAVSNKVSNTRNTRNRYKHCRGSGNAESKLASDFLVMEAILKLDQYGYKWLWRFADDSRLEAPITYNLFQRLENEKKLYGFVSIVRDEPTCADALWRNAMDYCKSLELIAKKGNQTSINNKSRRCSGDLLNPNRWRLGVAVTGMEVAHISLWKATQFQKLLEEVDRVPVESSNTIASDPSKVVMTYRNSDALIHTVGMLMQLRVSQMRRFFELPYRLTKRAGITPSPVTTKSLVNFNQAVLPSRFGWLGGDVASSFALPRPECFFVEHDTVVVRSDSTISEKEAAVEYVWLFGDSLIGTSSNEKRLEAQIVANVIGIMELPQPSQLIKHSSNHLKRMKHYWGVQDQTGEPTAIFDMHSMSPILQQQFLQMPKPSSLNLEKSIFWPSNGLSIIYALRNTIVVKAVIIGQLVQKIDEKLKNVNILDGADTALSFDEYGSLLMLIENPHASPSSWNYSPHIIPGTVRSDMDREHGIENGTKADFIKLNGNVQESSFNRKTRFSKRHIHSTNSLSSNVPVPTYRWTSMASSSGKPYVLQDEFIYLVGLRTSGSMDLESESESAHMLFASYHVVGRISALDVGKKRFDMIELMHCVGSKASWYNYPVQSPSLNKLLLDMSTMNSPGLKHICKLPSHIPSEASLHYHADEKRWLLSSLKLYEMFFTLCYSANSDIWSAWSCVRDDYTAIEAPWDKSGLYNVYAGQAHPELLPYVRFNQSLSNTSSSNTSSKNKIRTVLTYVPNPLAGPGALMDRHEFNSYIPKFVYAEIDI